MISNPWHFVVSLKVGKSIGDSGNVLMMDDRGAVHFRPITCTAQPMPLPADPLILAPKMHVLDENELLLFNHPHLLIFGRCRPEPYH